MAKKIQGRETVNSASNVFDLLARRGGQTTDLTTSHSVLRDPRFTDRPESQYDFIWVWALYLVAWIPMMLISLWVFIHMWIWRGLNRRLLKEDEKGRIKWILGPSRMTWAFDKAHSLGKLVRHGVVTSQALAVVNNIATYLSRQRLKWWEWFVLWFWLMQPDGRAVTYRLFRVRDTTRDELEQRYVMGQREFRVGVLASGSAQASLEGVAAFLRICPEARVHITLVDTSRASLERAQELARDLGLEKSLETHCVSIGDFMRRMSENGKMMDGWEVVGFFDYHHDHRIIEYLTMIRQCTAPKGWCISAMIAPSLWQFSVSTVINWPKLRRRFSWTYVRLVRRAGWSDLRVLLDPYRIHTVVVSYK